MSKITEYLKQIQKEEVLKPYFNNHAMIRIAAEYDEWHPDQCMKLSIGDSSSFGEIFTRTNPESLLELAEWIYDNCSDTPHIDENKRLIEENYSLKAEADYLNKVIIGHSLRLLKEIKDFCDDEHPNISKYKERFGTLHRRLNFSTRNYQNEE